MLLTYVDLVIPSLAFHRMNGRKVDERLWKVRSASADVRGVPKCLLFPQINERIAVNCFMLSVINMWVVKDR